jgi:dCMP deaminase
MKFDKSSLEWDYVKHDKNVLCEWLRWEKLFDAGLQVNTINSEFKSILKHVRLKLIKCQTLEYEEFESTLLDLDFNKRIIEDLYKLANKDLFAFINFMYHSTSFHNNEISYWTEKGWTHKESRTQLSLFFKSGAHRTNVLRHNPIYDAWYKTTRIPGAIASSKSYKNCKSIRETEILHELNKFLNVDEHFYSPVNNRVLKTEYNKHNFLHDFYLTDYNTIIEYNGVYWHRDNNYEILKAHNCIYESGRNDSFKYIALWEDYSTDINEYVGFVLKSLTSTKRFISTRENDFYEFDEYRKKFLKTENTISKIKDVVQSLCTESKCLSKQVSCVAVKDGRIVSTGINGTMPGLPNCEDYFKILYLEEYSDKFINFDEFKNSEIFKDLHHEWSLVNEIHAEQQMIGYAARHGISLEGSDIYVSLEPCKDCAKLISAVSPANVFYVNEYERNSKQSRQFIRNSGINFEKI